MNEKYRKKHLPCHLMKKPKLKRCKLLTSNSVSCIMKMLKGYPTYSAYGPEGGELNVRNQS